MHETAIDCLDYPLFVVGTGDNGDNLLLHVP